MTTPSPRRPKRKDHERIALQAAQASLQSQTRAHVAVLEAAEDLEARTTELAAAETNLRRASYDHDAAIKTFADLIGVPAAADRLGLPESRVKAAAKTAERPLVDSPEQPTGTEPRS